MLRESGLVRDQRIGRHRRCSLVRSPPGDLTAWPTQFDAQPVGWSQRLAALETEVHRARRDRGRADTSDDHRTAHRPEEDTA
ncbi:hypothetical protein ACWD5F_05165 [Streptomyces sp. NPDC002499]